MTKKWKAHSQLLTIMVTSLLLLLLFCSGSENKDTSAEDSKKAPDFTLPSIDDKPATIHLADLKGKAVLVNFWATWCPPCLKEIPEIVELRKKFKKSDLEIIGIALPQGNTRNRLIAFREKMMMNYTIVMDDGKVAVTYEVVGIPTSFLLDKEGKIAWKITGMPQPGTFEKEVQKLLDKS